MVMMEKYLQQPGGVPMSDDSRSNTNSINFWMENVMNISEATRQNKLAEILESYATKKNAGIYIIQNSKRKEAAGVISSVGYHLSREKAIENLEDEVLRLSEEVLRLKTQVRAEQPVYTFAEALERLKFDQDDLRDIFETADEVEID
jgi:hypothetical protein